MAKLAQRVRSGRDRLAFTGQLERRAESIQDFSDRIVFNDLRPRLICHGGCGFLEAGRMAGSERSCRVSSRFWVAWDETSITTNRRDGKTHQRDLLCPAEPRNSTQYPWPGEEDSDGSNKGILDAAGISLCESFDAHLATSGVRTKWG